MTDGGVRIVRVRVDGLPRWGVVEGQGVLDLLEPPFGGELRRGRSLGLVDGLELLAPVVPTKVVCVGRNYVEHAAEHGVEVPTEPLLFFKPPSSVVGPGDAIVLPRQSERVEHEAELAVVIGRRCRNVAAAEALGCRAGHHLRQRRHRPRPAASRRPVDPGQGLRHLLPAGAVGRRRSRRGQGLRPGGRAAASTASARQNGRTRHMVFPPAALIEYVTSVMTLEPGRRAHDRDSGRGRPAARGGPGRGGGRGGGGSRQPGGRVALRFRSRSRSRSRNAARVP